MKKFIFIAISFIFIITLLFSDTSITRGPAVGEIYYIGPTVTGQGIYYSTDFGETAVCVDSISEAISICADLTTGSLYRTRMPDVLYYSNDYGNYGSWVFRSNDISSILSGRQEGFVFNGKGSHSENYGINFVNHSCNGYFGSLKAVEIDIQNNVGYTLSHTAISDSVFLLVSYDNFENLVQQYVFDLHWSTKMQLTRGFENGEFFLFYDNVNINDLNKHLMYSNDYGNSWELKNVFNCPNLPVKGFVGGRQPGELYMLVEYVQLMHEIQYTYIYYSLDFGETFTVYNPFSYGSEPNYANFFAETTEGTVPLDVQFTDLSGGEEIQTWEWDFNDDGIIDSYEQNPEYTYQDTGYFSVRLHITIGGGIGEEAYAFREDYIHVTENNACNDEFINNSKIELSNSPNPLNPKTTISYNLPSNTKNTIIEIYNMKGQLIDKLLINNNQNSIEWNAEGFSSGIYLYKLNIENSSVKKMLLIK